MIRHRCFILLLPIAMALAPTALADPTATPELVNDMLTKARAYIYSQQKDGLWETHPAPPTADEIKTGYNKVDGAQWGGETALAVYALLASGESAQDPKLIEAVKFLETAQLKGMYALGIRSQLYDFLPPSKEIQKLASADVELYKDALLKKKTTAGLFDYLVETRGDTRLDRVDHSVSQYGVLGAWACERAGAEVPSDFWNAVQKAWVRDQGADGGWGYSKGPKYPPTASMVLAGTATLFITQDYLNATSGINCTGNITNKPIDAGLKWIADNFDRIFTDKAVNSPYYAIYGMERVGVASGRKYFNDINWYQRGADFLLSKKNANGSWPGGLNSTCFSVLFLSRGKAPVVFDKLQYDIDGKEGPWNERPRDVANLTHWIGKQTEHDLNWQIVSLNASVHDLLDAPVLYLSGNKALKFTADEESKIKQFAEDGGLIMGNPDCANPDFAQSFRKLGMKLFPAYEFRELPADHPIYTNQQYPRSGWKPAPSVLSLGNGVRELMMITPAADPARHWQTQETGRFESEFQLADDIFLYAVDKKNLLEKGKTFTVYEDPAITTDRSIKLARLQYNGNWDPEPGGWRRLGAILHNTSHIKLDVSTAKLGTGQLGDSTGDGAKIASLTGTALVKLDAASRQELKTFVERGGTLIVDAAGGNSDFAASIESELQIIFGAQAAVQLKQPLLATDPVFNLPGGEIKSFVYRSFARSTVGSLHGPLLTCFTVNKRPGVYYSRMDLSGGIVGQPTDGITGYDPATATDIMRNLVIFSGLGATSSVLPAGK